MSRKKKYLTKKEDVRSKWFGNHRSFSLIIHPANVSKQRNTRPNGYVTLSSEEEALELEHLRALAGDHDYSDDELRDNSNKTNKLIGYELSEQKLFTYHVLNRFLNADDSLTLKEFLDERWDSIIDEMNCLIFDSHTHSNRLFSLISHGDQFLLTIRQNGSREAREAVEALTVTQVRTLLKAGGANSYEISSDRLHRVPAAMVKDTIEDILGEGDDEIPPYVEGNVLTNQIYRGLASSIAAHGGALVIENLLERSLVYVPRVMNIFHGEKGRGFRNNKKPGTLPNGYLAPLTRVLEKRGGEIHPLTYFGIIYALGEPRSFTSEVNLKGTSVFKVAYDCDSERQFAFLRALGELATRHNGALPNAKHWEEFLKGEGVEESVEIGVDFILAMISDEDEMRDQRAKATHEEFHAVLKRFTR